MPIDIDIPQIYTGRSIYVWVEDAMTRDYLNKVWNDPQVGFLIAGGNAGVTAVLKDAESMKMPHVFGVIDRDFAPSNYPDWNSPTKTSRRFVLPVHEVENYLLDAEALAKCRLNNIGKSKDEIDTLMRTKASESCWWMSVRFAVSVLARRFRDHFIPHPPCEAVNSQSEALSYILNSEWYRSLESNAKQSKFDDICNIINNGNNKAMEQVNDGSWKVEFSGSEIFRDIRSRIYDSSRHRASKTQLDIAVARSVADWQLAANKVPPVLTELLDALRGRINRLA